MTPVNNYLTQREREMHIAQSRAANITHNVACGGLVQRLVRAFGSRDTRNHREHAAMPPRTIGNSQSMPGEVI